MSVKCPWCKKEFVPAIEHVYKYRGKLVCTWSCLCRLRENGTKKKESIRKRNDEIYRLYHQGMKTAELAEMFHMSIGHVSLIISREATGLTDEV